MIEDVVAGWDGSATAVNAAEWAADRQRGRGRLTLLHVRPERTGPDVDERAVLEGEVARLQRAHPGLEVLARIVAGDRLAALAAAATDTAVLVIGTRTRSDVIGSAGRSFALRVAATAAGPVVVVPDLAVGVPGDRVVVGVDGSAASVAAALVAAEEAVRRDQPLLVVHAWWETVGRTALLPFEAHVVDTLESAHRQVLDECADVVARRFPDLELTRLTVHAPSGDALADASRYASLVVLGRHAGAVPIPALLGATARGLLQRVAVPTMVVGLPRPALPARVTEGAAAHA